MSQTTGDRWTSRDPPVRIDRPMLYQSWRDCAFVHWRYEAAALRSDVPRSFEIETFDGSAWVGIISFRMPRMRPAMLPRIPGIGAAGETHIRTYVRGPDGRGGIWLFALHIDPLQAALAGRFGFVLPYWWTSMEVARGTADATYRVKGRPPKTNVGFELALGLGPPVPERDVGALDDFLTARWVLYSGLGPVRAAVAVDHGRWRFRRARLRRLHETITEDVGLPPPSEEPLVHFSDGVDARIAWPRPFLARRR